MKKKLALTLCLAAIAVPATARDDEPSLPTEAMIREFAFNYMKAFPKDWNDRQIANHLAFSILLLEKVQLLCPMFYRVNANRARFKYMLLQGTWGTMFGPGKTATSILNETATKFNDGFNNTLQKQVVRGRQGIHHKAAQVGRPVRGTECCCL
jgi:hypothetical protein